MKKDFGIEADTEVFLCVQSACYICSIFRRMAVRAS